MRALSDQSCRRALVFGRESNNINADEVFDRDRLQMTGGEDVVKVVVEPGQ